MPDPATPPPGALAQLREGIHADSVTLTGDLVRELLAEHDRVCDALVIARSAVRARERRGVTEPRQIAALYGDPRGCYANLPGVELWDEARDARKYAGPWPVVA